MQISFHPQKNLGQHFLKDRNIAKKIVSIADIKENDCVWEIGPGKGILTEELLNKNCFLTVFEIDKKLYPILEKRFGNKIKLIKNDILKADWKEIFPKNKIKIVSNLPFQITSPFLYKVTKFYEHFSEIVIMVQKEVAMRINAKSGNKKYGKLSLKMQYYYNIKYEFTIKPHLFHPPPKVDSAIINLQPRKDKQIIEDEKLFWKIVKISFKNRRKMLRNNLSELFNNNQFNKLKTISSIELTRRAESLSENEFIKLYQDISSILGN